MTPTPEQIETRAIQIQARTYRGPWSAAAARIIAKAELQHEFALFRAGWIAGSCGTGRMFLETDIETDWHRGGPAVPVRLVEEPADG